jgi:hypothetical protein
VLLTKIDRVCEITGEDLSQVFHSQTIQETVDRVSQIMGLELTTLVVIGTDCTGSYKPNNHPITTKNGPDK